MTSRTFDPLRREVAQKQARLGPVFEGEMARRLVAAAPKRSGAMARSIRVELDHRTPTGNRLIQKLRWVVEVRVPYATYNTEGTRPHEIRPVRAGALAFFWEKVGRFVFFMKVNHPGNAPNYWYRDTFERTSELLERLWRRF